MEPILEKATRELFAGNRSEVVKLLQGHSRDTYGTWLLACATDNEDERKRLLQQIQNSGAYPYADYARAILKREDEFDKLMNEAPRWQNWLLERRNLFMQIIITVVVLAGTVIIGSTLIVPPAPAPAVIALTAMAVATQQAQDATATTLAQTPTATATQSELESSKRTSVTYGNVGTLTVVSVERATNRRIGGINATPIPPPQAAEYVAVEYDFLCGKAQAICQNPPEAAISLRVADSSLPEIPVLTDVMVLDRPIPPQVAAGSVVRGWLVFAVPKGQVPVKLLIQIRTDQQNPTPQIFELVLPKSSLS